MTNNTESVKNNEAVHTCTASEVTAEVWQPKSAYRELRINSKVVAKFSNVLKGSCKDCLAISSNGKRVIWIGYISSLKGRWVRNFVFDIDTENLEKKKWNIPKNILLIAAIISDNGLGAVIAGEEKEAGFFKKSKKDKDELDRFLYRDSRLLGKAYDFPNIVFSQDGKTLAWIAEIESRYEVWVEDKKVFDSYNELNSLILSPDGSHWAVCRITSSQLPNEIVIDGQPMNSFDWYPKTMFFQETDNGMILCCYDNSAVFKVPDKAIDDSSK